MESSEASKVFIRREKSTVRVYRHTGRLRERESLSLALMQFESLLWGISLGFPLANHYDLPGSQSLFGISQDPPMYAHASLSQDGFYRKGIWVEHPLTELFFGLQEAFLHRCGQWSPDFANEKYVVWTGPRLLALTVLLFSHVGFNSQEMNPGGRTYLLPQYL